MPTREYDRGTDVHDAIPDDEDVESIRYISDGIIVETEESDDEWQESDYHRQDCEVEGCDDGPFETVQEYAGHMNKHNEGE